MNIICPIYIHWQTYASKVWSTAPNTSSSSRVLADSSPPRSDSCDPTAGHAPATEKGVSINGATPIAGWFIKLWTFLFYGTLLLSHPHHHHHHHHNHHDLTGDHPELAIQNARMILYFNPMDLAQRIKTSDVSCAMFSWLIFLKPGAVIMARHWFVFSSQSTAQLLILRVSMCLKCIWYLVFHPRSLNSMPSTAPRLLLPKVHRHQRRNNPRTGMTMSSLNCSTQIQLQTGPCS